MKLQVLLIVGFALSVTGCEKKEQAAPEQADKVQTTAPVAEKEDFRNDEFLKHMHVHADQIDRINAALAEDDLDGAMTPAFWLWRHDMVSGIPTDWQPYVVGMREAARAVETAADLESARAAAKRITEQCQGCHVAAGIIGDGVEPESD